MPTALFDWLAQGITQASIGQMAVFLLVVCQLTMMSSTLYLHRSALTAALISIPSLHTGFVFWSWLSTGMVTRNGSRFTVTSCEM